ncbi:MAG TPA: MerR family transcriptional regulator [Planctomycetota bacterium]|nr:MerR family transcriptional regulator [Planctomycetota bacterium]
MAKSRAASSPGVYKMHTITRLTGLSPGVLRAWENRFGFIVPQRAPKGHRLYSEDDLAILRHVKTLLEAGRSIGEVALAGHDGLLEQAKKGPPSEPSPMPVTTSTGEARSRSDPDVPLAKLRDRIVQSAVDLDEESAIEAIDAAFARVTPETALGEVVVPAARAVGQRWGAGKCSVAGEHLVSGLVEERVRRLLDAGRARTAGPVTICACFPDELHELGSLVVAYQLARLGNRVVVLGASLPIEELDRACDRLHPIAVCLSVSRESVLQTHQPALVSLVKRRHDVAFFVGGEGARGDRSALEAAGVTVWSPERPIAELAAAIARRVPVAGSPKRSTVGRARHR